MNIIELAREAMGTRKYVPPVWQFFDYELEHFAQLVRAAALEEAAGVCDELRHPWGYSAETSDWVRGTEHCAAAIRALKEKT